MALTLFAHPFECMRDPPNRDIVHDIIEYGEMRALCAHAERCGGLDIRLVRILGDASGGCGTARIVLAPSFVARYFGWKPSNHAIAKHLLALHLILDTDYVTVPATDEAARETVALSDELASAPASADAPTKKKRERIAPFYAVTRAALRDLIARCRAESAQELRVFLARLDAIMPEFNRARYHVISEQSYRGGMHDAEVARSGELPEHLRIPAPEEYIYIATTHAYEARDIYKVGRAKNLQSRLSSYNTGRAADDCMFYKFHAACYNPGAVETYILQATLGFIDQNEMRTIKYEILEHIVKRMVRCDKKCAKIAHRARILAESARASPVIEEAAAAPAAAPPEEPAVRKPRKQRAKN